MTPARPIRRGRMPSGPLAGGCVSPGPGWGGRLSARRRCAPAAWRAVDPLNGAGGKGEWCSIEGSGPQILHNTTTSAPGSSPVVLPMLFMVNAAGLAIPAEIVVLCRFRGGAMASAPGFPSLIWRWCCQGVGLGVRGVGGCGGDVVAGGGAVRACSDFATVVSLISGGWVPQDVVFVARPLSRVECRRWAAGSWGNRGLWCARVPGGPGRLVSRNGLWVAFRSWRARARAGRGVRA